MGGNDLTRLTAKVDELAQEIRAMGQARAASVVTPHEVKDMPFLKELEDQTIALIAAAKKVAPFLRGEEGSLRADYTHDFFAALSVWAENVRFQIRDLHDYVEQVDHRSQE